MACPSKGWMARELLANCGMESTIRLSRLIDVTCGERATTRSENTLLAITVIAAGLVLASIWGIAAGSSSPALALANAVQGADGRAAVRDHRAARRPRRVALTNARLGGVELAERVRDVDLRRHARARDARAARRDLLSHQREGRRAARARLGVRRARHRIVAVRTRGRTPARRRQPDAPHRSSRSCVLVGLFLAALLQFVALASPIIGVGDRVRRRLRHRVRALIMLGGHDPSYVARGVDRRVADRDVRDRRPGRRLSTRGSASRAGTGRADPRRGRRHRIANNRQPGAGSWCHLAVDDNPIDLRDHRAGSSGSVSPRRSGCS